MIEVDEHGAVTELRLERPPVNALNPELVETLDARLVEAVENDARAVVMTGGEGMFSAGLDVPVLLRLSREEMDAFWKSFFGLMERIATAPVPVVAGLTGHSPAGGAVLAIFCDYRVMSQGDYRIGLNETQVGLPVPDVICHGLARLVGRGTANRMLVSGEMLDPEEARRIGMVDALAEDPEQTRQAAVEWAGQVAGLPAKAVARTRATIRADLAKMFRDLGEQTRAEMLEVWFSDETQQAMHALVERLAAKH